MQDLNLQNIYGMALLRDPPPSHTHNTRARARTHAHTQLPPAAAAAGAAARAATRNRRKGQRDGAGGGSSPLPSAPLPPPLPQEWTLQLFRAACSRTSRHTAAWRAATPCATSTTSASACCSPPITLGPTASTLARTGVGAKEPDYFHARLRSKGKYLIWGQDVGHF